MGVRAIANALADADLREVLPSIDVPTLLVHGDVDQRAPLSVAEELHARIPGSKLVVIPGARPYGHPGSTGEGERRGAELPQGVKPGKRAVCASIPTQQTTADGQ